MTTTRTSLRPPTDRTGLADPATTARQTLRVLLMIIAALVVASFLVGIRW